jgi:hypothetical protein
MGSYEHEQGPAGTGSRSKITPVPEGEYPHYSPFYDDERQQWFYVTVDGRRRYAPLGYYPRGIHRPDDYDPMRHAEELNRLLGQGPPIQRPPEAASPPEAGSAWPVLPSPSTAPLPAPRHRRFGPLGRLLRHLARRRP